MAGRGAAGDLDLRVRFARHPDLRVRGDDIYYDLDLAPWEVVLGVNVKIPLLGSTATLVVPAGTTAGMQLRMCGQGLPREGSGRGDLYATVRIQTPTPCRRRNVFSGSNWPGFPRSSPGANHE